MCAGWRSRRTWFGSSYSAGSPHEIVARTAAALGDDFAQVAHGAAHRVCHFAHVGLMQHGALPGEELGHSCLRQPDQVEENRHGEWEREVLHELALAAVAQTLGIA